MVIAYLEWTKGNWQYLQCSAREPLPIGYGRPVSVWMVPGTVDPSAD